MEKLRLNKFLRNCGLGSRRAVEELILAGKVKINGVTTQELGAQVSDSDLVTVNEKPVRATATFVYYILNKPKGYLCTHKSHNGDEPTIYDLFPKSPPLFSIGRLDKDTTGLLIVTNDGDFANKVIHPSSNITKEYIATTYDEILVSHLQRIKEGTVVENTKVTPHLVEKVSSNQVKIVIKEGKKREVRILVWEAGLDLKELTRTRIGGLHIGKLPEGHYRPLTENERLEIFSVGKN